MSPFYLAAICIAVSLLVALLDEDADDDNDDHGGGILQPVYAPTAS